MNGFAGDACAIRPRSGTLENAHHSRGLMDAGLTDWKNKMNEIVLAVLKEYFEHTTGDVTLEQIETCAQAISEALETAQLPLEPTKSIQKPCRKCVHFEVCEARHDGYTCEVFTSSS